MRTITLSFLALALATAIHLPAQAAEVEKTVTPVATAPQNPVFEYSARKVLGYVSEARVASSNRQKDAAMSYIDAAQIELANIRNTKNHLETVGVRFGRVLYGDTGSYYIPIADDTYAVRSYAHGPFWSSDKAIAVRDVQLLNVDIAINPEKAIARLDTAKQKLGKDDWSAADDELEALLSESIRETASSGQPLTQLMDNIYLTRVLVRQSNFDGARYTLKHAKSALDDYEKTATDAQKTRATALRQEIDSLQATIDKRDPTMMQQAASKVDEWWTDLKAWTKEKTL
ncbi:MAG: YfdX family protein [Alphaproteobacteria bacterium]|nr:YfdX family protein [Alphaproteobacteria bacterium]